MDDVAEFESTINIPPQEQINVQAAIQEVDRKSVIVDSTEVAKFKELVAKYPWAYLVARGIADGQPKEVLQNLHLYKTSDKLKEVLARFLAGIPDGITLTNDYDRVKQFIEAPHALKAAAKDQLSQVVVRVNRFNASEVLAQFVDWTPIRPTREDLFANKISVNTVSGKDSIDFASNEKLFKSVVRLIQEKTAAKQGYKYVIDEEDSLAYDMTFFLMSCFRVTIEEGVYVFSENYDGDSTVPSTWIDLGYELLKRLNGRTPSGYLVFTQTVRASLYSDIIYLLNSDTIDAKFVYRNSTYTTYNAYADKVFSGVGFTVDTIKKAFNKATQEGWTMRTFLAMKEEERRLGERRKNNQANFDELLGEKELGFDYPHLNNHVFSSFTILYHSAIGAIIKDGQLKYSDWKVAVTKRVHIVMCGQDVAHRAKVLEDVCEMLGWGLSVSRDSRPPIGKHAYLFPTDAEWGKECDRLSNLANGRPDVIVVYWMGLGNVEVHSDTPRWTGKGGTDDSAIIQLIGNFHVHNNKQRVVFMVHHDVMIPDKLRFEMDVFSDKCKTLSVSMIGHPSCDSGSMVWCAVAKRDQIKPGPVTVWGTKVIEVAASKRALESAAMIGKPRHFASTLLEKELAQFVMCAVQWQRIRSREAGKSITSVETSRALQKYVSQERGEASSNMYEDEAQQKENAMVTEEHLQAMHNAAKIIEASKRTAQFTGEGFESTLDARLNCLDTDTLRSIASVFDNQNSSEYTIKRVISRADAAYKKFLSESGMQE